MSVTVFFTNRDGPKLHISEPSTRSTRCTLEYLNEGGANFVFRILTDAGKGPPSQLKGKLLRLRKDLPHVQSANEQLRAFDTHFKPLFAEENLIEHEPIAIDEYFPEILDEALKAMERPSHRLNDFLPPDETHGLLVTDMSPGGDGELLQLKPKWLAPSPNAPSNARRCRTCALRAQRASKNVRTATDAQETCPLDLISDDVEDRNKVAQQISSNTRLQRFLVSSAHPLLQTLRESQIQLDPKGVLGISTTDAAVVQSLCKAMTLRDCTLFLRRTGNHVEARLADLDLKTAEKLDKWAEVERGLVSEGWYENQEGQEVWAVESVCLLSRIERERDLIHLMLEENRREQMG